MFTNKVPNRDLNIERAEQDHVFSCAAVYDSATTLCDQLNNAGRQISENLLDDIAQLSPAQRVGKINTLDLLARAGLALQLAKNNSLRSATILRAKKETIDTLAENCENANAEITRKEGVIKRLLNGRQELLDENTALEQDNDVLVDALNEAEDRCDEIGALFHKTLVQIGADQHVALQRTTEILNIIEDEVYGTADPDENFDTSAVPSIPVSGLDVIELADELNTRAWIIINKAAHIGLDIDAQTLLAPQEAFVLCRALGVNHVHYTDENGQVLACSAEVESLNAATSSGDEEE